MKARGMLSLSIRKKIALAMLLPVIVFSAGFHFSSIISTDIVKDQTSEHLLVAAQQRALWLDSYFTERMNDIKGLESSLAVQSILERKLTAEKALAQEGIRARAEEVALEVGEYISSHPGMTIEQLQEDPAFQEIAVQQVGETGYTALTDYETLVCRFHSSPGIVDLDLHELSGRLPGFWSVMSRTRGGQDAEGFYGWEEPDGSIREKYMYIAIADGRTADGVGLSIAATTYLDDYSIKAELEERPETGLRSFASIHGYYDVFLIGSDGKVWWTAKNEGEQGTNLETGLFNGSEFALAYKEARASGNVTLSDFEIHRHTGMPAMFAVMPLHEGGSFAGAVALQFDTHRINRIMSDTTGMGETGETYIVGSDYTMRSSSRFLGDGAVLSEEIRTENARNCFLHAVLPEEEIREMHQEVGFMTDYRGTRVLGTHIYIPEMDWCILAEIDEGEALATVRSSTGISIIVVAFLTAISLLASTLVSRSITRPILMLRDATGRAVSERKPIKVRVRSRDETGELARTFNSMLDEIKRYKSEIGEHERELEKQVRERTKELESSKRKLEEKVEELEKLNRMSTGRELRMIELKKRIRELEKGAGK